MLNRINRKDIIEYLTEEEGLTVEQSERIANNILNNLDIISSSPYSNEELEGTTRSHQRIKRLKSFL